MNWPVLLFWVLLSILVIGIPLGLIIGEKKHLNRIRKQLPQMNEAVKNGFFNSEKLSEVLRDFDGFEKKQMMNIYLMAVCMALVFLLVYLSKVDIDLIVNENVTLAVAIFFLVVFIVLRIRYDRMGKDVFDKFKALEEMNK